MKQSITLIIIFLHLLTSHLFGLETGVLYQYVTSSGFVWRSIGSDKLQPKYKGEIKNGVPNGKGTLFFPDGEKQEVEFKDGQF